MVDFLIRRIEFLYAKMYLSSKCSKLSIKLGEAVNETLQGCVQVCKLLLPKVLRGSQGSLGPLLGKSHRTRETEGPDTAGVEMCLWIRLRLCLPANADNLLRSGHGNRPGSVLPVAYSFLWLETSPRSSQETRQVSARGSPIGSWERKRTSMVNG